MAIAMAVMSVVVFVQVVFRFIVKSSLPWSEELVSVPAGVYHILWHSLWHPDWRPSGRRGVRADLLPKTVQQGRWPCLVQIVRTAGVRA